MRILREDTVAVLVDVQEKLLPHIHQGDLLLSKCLQLIKGLQLLEVPVIVTEQYVKGLGVTVPELREALPDYSPVEKLTFSCCGSYAFMQKIIDSGRSNVILMGIEAHVCVMQTAIDFSAKGYQPVVIHDAVSSRNPEDKTIALNRMRQAKCIHSTVESVLFELCNSAANPVFKQLSAIIK
jgi:nicotinamidase-related amidase